MSQLTQHLRETLGRLYGVSAGTAKLDLRKLAADQRVERLAFVMVSHDPSRDQYCYLIDSAVLTDTVEHRRVRPGCFVFNKALWDRLNADDYLYWFAVVNGELLPVKNCTVKTLFERLAIKLTASNSDYLVRDIEYSDVAVKLDFSHARRARRKRNPFQEAAAV